MQKRFMTIWFPFLMTDWLAIRQKELKDQPYVLTITDHGRKLVSEPSYKAQQQGIVQGMLLADARVIIPGIKDIDEEPGLSYKLLQKLARYCYRFTPLVAIDLPNNIMLDISGCTHLWKGEENYIDLIASKLKGFGFHINAAIAGTIGTAWAIAHFGNNLSIIKSGDELHALQSLHPAALRLESSTVDRILKLGWFTIAGFINMQRTALRRRFGPQILLRIDQALGREGEFIEPVQQLVIYQERLPCLDPIITYAGIEIALKNLLQTLSDRLAKDGKGIRLANFISYKTDHGVSQVSIGTNRASHNVEHLFKLFEIKLSELSPEPGIELFILEAKQIDEVQIAQHGLWNTGNVMDDIAVMELLDRIANKFGSEIVQRYLPDEHYWPERSVKPAESVKDLPKTAWRKDRSRPVRLLDKPVFIQVAAPIPDYPPMNFRFKGKLYKVVKADGPERIEHEWWLEHAIYRDYYCVEDEEGGRYWIFRAGSYDGSNTPQWYLHGFFA